MKKRSDPRHIKRIRLMQNLFSYEFNNQNVAPGKLLDILANLKKIDPLIEKAAPDRPVSQINRIDLSILRLSIFELIIEKEQPPKVVVDEAVELAKEYGSDSSPAFINGVLGQVIKLQSIAI